MPDPISAFCTFSIALSVGISLWKGNWGCAAWLACVLCFLVYLHYYSYSKSKLEK